MDTKGMLGNALLDLLSERPLKSITVSDIVSRCGLARSTFYKHFTDKYDLAAWALADVRFKERKDFFVAKGYRATLDYVLSLAEEWRDVYKNALDDPNAELLYNRLFENLAAGYEIDMGMAAGADSDRVHAVIKNRVMNTIMDFAMDWTKGNVDLSREEAVEVLVHIWPTKLSINDE